MTAGLALKPQPAASRIRLIALALAGWHDALPMPGSNIRGESGKGETTNFSKRETNRARDELLLRLEKPEEAMEGREDDANVVAIDRHLDRRLSPFWKTMLESMTVLGVLDSFGHRLIVETLMDPRDPRGAFARIHALKYVAGGQPGVPLATPRAALLRALIRLDKELLPHGLVFPAYIHAQVDSWEAWLAAIRPKKTQSGKIVRASTSDGKDVDSHAYDMRDRYVRELANYGLTQQQIATDLGLSQPLVSKILGGKKPLDTGVWIDKRDGRVYRDVTENFEQPRLRLVEV